MYPIVIEAKEDLVKNIIDTKEMLRKIPNHGIGYGILKYLGKHDIEVNGEITFNYLGDFGTVINDESGMQASQMNSGESISKENQYGTDLIFNGSIVDERLSFIITYNEKNILQRKYKS